jgi:hypothetical protein
MNRAVGLKPSSTFDLSLACTNLEWCDVSSQKTDATTQEIADL